MHEAQIRVAIVGAGGRMGRQLIQAAMAMEGVQLGAALEREGSSLLGSDAGELAGVGKTGVIIQSDLASVKDDFDVLVDLPVLKAHWRIWHSAVNMVKGW